MLAFVMLLANLHLRPYADAGLNFVNTVAQLNLFLCVIAPATCAWPGCVQERTDAPCVLLCLSFLFVALLLKVNLDGTNGSSFFSYVVGVMSVVPISLPLFIRLWLRFYGTLEARMLVKDSTFSLD